MDTRTDLSVLVGATLGNYRLNELLDYAAHGPFFLAQHTTTQATFIVQVLALPTRLAPDARAAYLARFESLVAPIAALQHPYILPVVDAGQARGVPYLVFPAIAPRSLSARLLQSGPVDVLTAGRYLDQLTGALEYAHEHDIFHGALAADCIFIQRNGNLIVADFGVQQILSAAGPNTLDEVAAGNGDAIAPEQLRGMPAQSPTDVYALSAVVYRLLTGHAVFEGPSFNAVAQQTLHAPVPSVHLWRADLPQELDALFAQALAKDPDQRFRRPGVFANAYHQLVAPFNASRIPFVDAAPQHAGGPKSMPTRKRPESQAIASHEAPAGGGADLAPPPPPQMLHMGIPYPPPRRKVEFGRVFASVILILLIALSGIFVIQNHFAQPPKATGVVHFFDQTGQAGHVNALRIAASNLPKPAAGTLYHVWLIDTANEQITSLGTLQPQGKDYVLAFAPTGPQAAVNLLGAGDQIEITPEKGQIQVPTGTPVLRGIYPPQVFVHIRHLLVSFPTTPGKIGLLTGLLDQVTILHTAAQQLQAAVNGGQNDATRCLATSMIDIIEGAQGSHYHALSPACPGGVSAGDGYGVLAPKQTAQDPYTQSQAESGGYLAGAEDHATLAATQPDATSAMQARARQVAASLDAMATPAQKLDSDLVALANDPTATTALPEIMALTNRLYAGSGSGASAQGGVLTAYSTGLTIADLPLVAIGK